MERRKTLSDRRGIAIESAVLIQKVNTRTKKRKTLKGKRESTEKHNCPWEANPL